jgi:hypothetical protein
MPAVLACWLILWALLARLADADDQLIPQTVGWNAYVAHFVFMRDVWIRTQSAAV